MSVTLGPQFRLIGDVGGVVLAQNRDLNAFDDRWQTLSSTDGGVTFGAPAYFDAPQFAVGDTIFRQAIDATHGAVVTMTATSCSKVVAATLAQTIISLVPFGQAAAVVPLAAAYEDLNSRYVMLAMSPLDATLHWYTMAHNAAVWTDAGAFIEGGTFAAMPAWALADNKWNKLELVNGNWFLSTANTVARAVSALGTYELKETAGAFELADGSVINGPTGPCVQYCDYSTGNNLIAGGRYSDDNGLNWTTWATPAVYTAHGITRMLGVLTRAYDGGANFYAVFGAEGSGQGVKELYGTAATYGTTVTTETTISANDNEPYFNRSFLHFGYLGTRMVSVGESDVLSANRSYTVAQRGLFLINNPASNWQVAGGTVALPDPSIKSYAATASLDATGTAVGLIVDVALSDWEYAATILATVGGFALTGLPAGLSYTTERLSARVLRATITGTTAVKGYATITPTFGSGVGAFAGPQGWPANSAAFVASGRGFNLFLGRLDAAPVESGAFSTLLGAGSTTAATTLVDALFNSAAGAVSEATYSAVSDARFNSAMALDDYAVPYIEMYALWSEVLGVRDSALPIDKLVGGRKVPQRTVLVVNVTTGAVSRYENFDFDEFRVIDGKLHGINAEGLFLLDGDTDNGVPIDASFSLGKSAFGTPNVKTLLSAYITGQSKLPLKMRVRSEQGTFVYDADTQADLNKNMRIKLGRGLRSAFYGLEVYNRAGADFEAGTVRFDVFEGTRRI